MMTDNLFADVPHQLPNEQVVELLSAPNVRIERIVSTGHATPSGEWYDQDRAEWVLLLAGSAGLTFEGETQPLGLEPGSFIHIPAHARHRVDRPVSANRLARDPLSMKAGCAARLTPPCSQPSAGTECIAA